LAVVFQKNSITQKTKKAGDFKKTALLKKLSLLKNTLLIELRTPRLGLRFGIFTDKAKKTLGTSF
jgi:phage gp46-like protein